MHQTLWGRLCLELRQSPLRMDSRLVCTPNAGKEKAKAKTMTGHSIQPLQPLGRIPERMKSWLLQV